MTDSETSDGPAEALGRAKRVRDLFAKAIEQPEPERAQWLQTACEGDRTLLAEVREVLDSHLESIDDPPGDDAETFDPARDPEQFLPIGAMIGHYQIAQRIGEGGFGEVYLADQLQPVRRRVALKVIKLGMDTRSVIARFESERQALAMMDSPDIARVYDAGVTPDGRPYFVMEYVQGEPITAYCDTHQLDLTGRLQLFARLCDAIQYAHQKGIIHRDLKPSNILVTSHDREEPNPKVIDFGIAKATTQKLTDLTLFTQHGQLIGTPEYMSPEQADARTDDIDTRSDVYSLGVILYELLTGQVPFDRTLFRDSGLTEIQRIITTESPPRPCTILENLPPAELKRIAEARQVRPWEFPATLRRELEWIPLKALRKDRTDRYSSAEALGDDVRRYLAGVPLQAVPESTTYRLRKLIGRNRSRVLASTIITLLILIGGVLFSVSEIRARDAQRDATILQSIRNLDDEINHLLNTKGRFANEIDAIREQYAEDPLAEQLIQLYTQRYDQLELLHGILHTLDRMDLAALYQGADPDTPREQEEALAWADQVLVDLVMAPAIKRLTEMAVTSPESVVKPAKLFCRVAMFSNLGKEVVALGELMVACAAREQPPNPLELAMGFEVIGNGLTQLERFEDAEAAYTRSETILDTIDPQTEPRALERRWYLMVNRAELYEQTGQPERALADFERSIEFIDDPSLRTDMFDWSLMKVAMMCTTLGRYQDAMTAIDRCSYSDGFLSGDRPLKVNDEWIYVYGVTIIDALEGTGDLQQAATVARQLCTNREIDPVAQFMAELDDICERADGFERGLNTR